MDANDVQEGNSNDSNNQTISCIIEKDNLIKDQQENDRNVNDDEGLDQSSSSQISTTSSSLLLPPPPIYEINQKVECRYGVVVHSNENNNANHDNSSIENQWYDAIIRKMKLQPINTSTSNLSSSNAGDKNQNVPQSLEWSYLVHYQGWNSRYDQWCTGESIRIKPEINTNITTVTTSVTGNTSDNETSLPTTTNSTTPQRIKNNKRSPSRSPRHKSMLTSQSSEINGNRKRSRNNHSTTTTAHDNSTLSVPIVCTYSDYCKLPITLQIIVFEEHERMTNYCKYHHNQYPSKQQEKENDIHNQSLVYLHPLPASIPIRKVLNSFIKKKIKEIHKQQLLVTTTTTTNHLDHHHPTTTTTTTNESNNNDLHTPTKKMVHSSSTSETNNQQHRETIDPETKTSVSNSNNNNNNNSTVRSSLPIITEDIIRQFGKSLQELFQHALFKCLLYPIEREQYMNIVLPMLQQKEEQDEGEVDNEISNTNIDDDTNTATSSKKIKKKLELIDIYGCEYLLRLYIRLPMLLQGTMLYTTTSTTTTDGSTDTAVSSSTPLSSPYILGSLLSDLLIVLQKHRQTLFFTKS